jgi:hypothetical protein
MGDVVPLILMGVALVAMIISRALLAAARDHVRHQHPDWYAALGAGGGGIRLGGPEERARRRLTRPLLFGPLPEGPAADPVLRRVAEHLRLALLAAAISTGGFVLIVVLRAQFGTA